MLIDPRDAGQPLQTREVWRRWALNNPNEWEVARKFFLEMETYLPSNYYPNAEVETWELFPLDWDWIGVDMPYEFLTDQENYEELYVPRMKETLTEALLRVFRRGLAVRIEGTAMSLDELIKEDFWIESYQVAHLPLKKVTGKPRQDEPPLFHLAWQAMEDTGKMRGEIIDMFTSMQTMKSTPDRKCPAWVAQWQAQNPPIEWENPTTPSEIEGCW